MVSWKWLAENRARRGRRDMPIRNAAMRWSAVPVAGEQCRAADVAAEQAEQLRCRPGTRAASTEIFGNENRHSITVSSATALQG
jgi:hypothetical protein